ESLFHCRSSLERTLHRHRTKRGEQVNGIMHGSVDHLDYGSKVNGYKAFSLLCFVAFCFDLPSVKRLSSETPLASD
ncbi:hypothetical protein, partial [Burkholderia contaminans]